MIVHMPVVGLHAGSIARLSTQMYVCPSCRRTSRRSGIPCDRPSFEAVNEHAGQPGYAMEVRRTVFALVVVYWLKCGVCTPPLLLNYDDDRFEGSALNGPDDEDDEEASALPPEIYDDKHSMYVQPKFSTSQYDENDVVHHRIADSAFTVGTKNGAAAPEHDGLSSTAVYVVIASLIASIIFAVIILYIARRRRDTKREYKRRVPMKRP